MADYIPLEIVKFPRKPIFEASQSRYWKNYKNTFLRQDHSSITNIAVSPNYYAVTTSARVRFFTYENQNKFSLTRFRNTTIGGIFRSDGELFAAGDIEGSINLFQVSGKTLLRSYRHPMPAYGIQFMDKTNLITGCDDFTVRFWDISQKKPLWSKKEHLDYVRAVETSDNCILTGGMDGVVKVWDKNGEVAMDMDHGAPISAMCVAGNLLVTAGHVSYKVWDIRNAGQIFMSTPHSKNITCLGLGHNETKMLTGSIDCCLKIHNLSDFSVEFTMKYPDPILSAKMSLNNSHIIVGMSDGKLSVRQNKTKVKGISKADPMEELYLKKWEDYYKTMPEETVKNYRYFGRGVQSKAIDGELIADNEYKRKLREYDVLLRKFRYGEVLDLAFDTDRVDLTISILQELVLRNGLKDAMTSRDPQTICKIISFLSKKLHNPKYTNTILPISLLLTDMYSSLTDINPALHQAFKKLLKEVEDEYKQQVQAFSILGIIDYLIPE